MSSHLERVFDRRQHAISRYLIGCAAQRAWDNGAITVYKQHWTFEILHAMITSKQPVGTSLPARVMSQGISVGVRIYATRSE
jgi:hypothetical protein